VFTVDNVTLGGVVSKGNTATNVGRWRIGARKVSKQGWRLNWVRRVPAGKREGEIEEFLTAMGKGGGVGHHTWLSGKGVQNVHQGILNIRTQRKFLADSRRVRPLKNYEKMERDGGNESTTEFNAVEEGVSGGCIRFQAVVKPMGAPKT